MHFRTVDCAGRWRADSFASGRRGVDRARGRGGNVDRRAARDRILWPIADRAGGTKAWFSQFRQRHASHPCRAGVACFRGHDGRGGRKSAAVGLRVREIKRRVTMRFMMLMIPKGYEAAAPGTMPPAEAVAAMMKYNEALKEAGVLVTLDGLHPPSMGARVSFAGGEPVVTDGPFIEAKEVIGGYWMIDVT